jgi:hypothetical protein
MGGLEALRRVQELSGKGPTGDPTPTPETPEALARRLAGECSHESTCGFATCGASFDQGKAAALIAQLTAKLREWEERAAEAGVDELEQKLASAEQERDRRGIALARWEELALKHGARAGTDDGRMRSDLEAHLTASAQREASARAEAREAALKEAFGVVVEAFQGEAHERHPALFRAYCAIVDKLIPAHQPAAGTEGSSDG